MPRKEVLRKNLASFELRRDLRWTDHGKIPRAQRIAQAIYQGQFGSNDSQVRAKLFRDCYEAVDIASLNGKAGRILSDAAVSRRTPDLFHSRAFAKLPY